MNAVSFTQSFDACVGHALSPQQKKDLLAAKTEANGDWRKERELLKKKYSDDEINKILNDWDGRFSSLR